MSRPRPRDDRCVTCGHAPDCHEADDEELRACAVRMLGDGPGWVKVTFGLGELTVEEVDSILAVRGIAPADFWSHFVGKHKIDTDALRLACVRCAEEAADGGKT